MKRDLVVTISCDSRIWALGYQLQDDATDQRVPVVFSTTVRQTIQAIVNNEQPEMAEITTAWEPI